MAQRTTMAFYDADNDRVVVGLLTQQALSDRITPASLSHPSTVNL
jgi:hypothetical protein